MKEKKQFDIPFKVCGIVYLYTGYVYPDKNTYFKNLMGYICREEGHTIIYSGQPRNEETLPPQDRCRLLRRKSTTELIMENTKPEEFLICVAGKNKYAEK